MGFTRKTQLVWVVLALVVVFQWCTAEASLPGGLNSSAAESEPSAVPQPLEEDDDNFVQMKTSNGTRVRRRVGGKGSPIRYCAGDLEICRNYPKRSTADTWICMREQADYIQNSHCREYVIGFHICMQQVQRTDACLLDLPDWSTTVRHCMRAKLPSTISQECRDTAFYKNCREGLREDEVKEYE